MTIGKLAAAEGVGVETVRFYQRRGLLGQPARRGSGYREYSEEDRSRLAFIRRARQLGFTLGEIAELLGPPQTPSVQAGLMQDGSVQPGSVQPGSGQARAAGDIARAAEAKLAAIDAQMAELMRQRCRLRRLVHVCEHGSGAECAALFLPELAIPSGGSTAAAISDGG
jgi:DNA-binding transcriptional MerR regulator